MMFICRLHDISIFHLQTDANSRNIILYLLVLLSVVVLQTRILG